MAGQSPLCERYGQVIERSLKVIARDLTRMQSDELSAMANGGRETSVLKPAWVASAWAQIDVALRQRERMGCAQYPLVIDPSDYYEAVFACDNAAQGDRGRLCVVERWQRATWNHQ